MVIFEELRITNDGKTLIVRARVREGNAYQNIYINKVTIDTEETYTDGSDGSNGVYTETINDQKEITLYISTYKLDTVELKDHLFFVYVHTTGNITGAVPCGADNKVTMGVTLYMGDLYNRFMSGIKEVGKTCTVPKDFIDNLLKFKAMQLSLDSGHYTQGINYYKQWFKDDEFNTNLTPNCGCSYG